MFLNNYLDDFYLDLIYDTYDTDYINNLSLDNFDKVYKIFVKYNFYFINDIILKYLGIFEMDAEDVEEGILKLKDKLGSDYVYIIGHNMNYLDEI